MKASAVKLASLKTPADCSEAMESIADDHRNISGGLKAFNSGYQTYLTVEAQRKLDAISRKFDKLTEGLEA